MSARAALLGSVLIASNIFAAELGETPAPPGDKPEYLKRMDKFFEVFNQDDKWEPALLSLFATNPWFKKDSDMAGKVAMNLRGLRDLVGNYRSHTLLSHNVLAERFAYVYFFVAFDREPVAFELEWYRPTPKDKWMLFGFNFKSEIDDLMEEAMRAKMRQGFSSDTQRL